jgi:subtilase-type serine protease
MLNIPWSLKFFTAFCLLAALGGCGGGGGGGGAALMATDASTIGLSPRLPPPSPIPSTGAEHTATNTTLGAFGAEYDAQYGLRLINASAANDAGFTGWGVRTAVVDTGIDTSHPEFFGRDISGRNFGGGGPSRHLSDSVGHGTHVAAILAGTRDGSGMRGVAYDAQLYSYRISSFGGGPPGTATSLSGVASDSAWTEVIDQHTSDRIRVSNNSWGSTTTIDAVSESQLRATFTESIPALVRAQQQGTIFVFAAGNASAANPSSTGGMPARVTELKSQWLVVVAVDANLREASFTNRCGMAADFCVTAPGVNIYSAKANSTGYEELSGTSMAAPHVAGVVALVYQRFPELNAAEIANRVKATASLNDLQARNPDGSLGCTVSSCSDSDMRAIFGHGMVDAQAAINPIGVLVYSTDGDATSSSGHTVGSMTLMVPASLGANIESQLREVDVAVFDSFDGATFRVSADQVFNTQQKQALGAIGYAAATHALHAAQGIAPFAGTFAATNSVTPLYVSFSNNALTAMAATSWGDKAGLMSQPALLSDQAMQQFEWGLIQNDQLSVRPFTQFAQDEAGKLLGFGMNMSFRPTERLRAHISLAQSQSPTANSINGSYRTSAVPINSAEIGLEHDLTRNVAFFARSRLTELGATRATTDQWGIQGGQIFQHHVGLEFKRDDTKVAIGAYDPGQIRNGQLALLLPDARTPDGQVIYREQRFNVQQGPRVGAFIAAKAPIRLGAQNLGTVTLSIQQSPYESSRVGRASLTYSHQF